MLGPLRVLLELFGLHRRFDIVNLLKHSYVLIYLLFELVLSIHEVKGTSRRRVGLHPLGAARERLVPHVLYARQVYEDLLGLRVVPDTARLALPPNHRDILAIVIPVAHHAVRSACGSAEQHVPMADRRLLLLPQDAQVHQYVLLVELVAPVARLAGLTLLTLLLLNFA